MESIRKRQVKPTWHLNIFYTIHMSIGWAIWNYNFTISRSGSVTKLVLCLQNRDMMMLLAFDKKATPL